MNRLYEILMKRTIIENIDRDMKFYVVPWALSYTHDGRLFISGDYSYEMRKSGTVTLEIDRENGRLYCDLMQPVMGRNGAEQPGNIGIYLTHSQDAGWLIKTGHIEVFDRQEG